VFVPVPSVELVGVAVDRITYRTRFLETTLASSFRIWYQPTAGAGAGAGAGTGTGTGIS
jgi:hypothetical protein